MSSPVHLKCWSSIKQTNKWTNKQVHKRAMLDKWRSPLSGPHGAECESTSQGPKPVMEHKQRWYLTLYQSLLGLKFPCDVDRAGCQTAQFTQATYRLECIKYNSLAKLSTEYPVAGQQFRWEPVGKSTMWYNKYRVNRTVIDIRDEGQTDWSPLIISMLFTDWFISKVSRLPAGTEEFHLMFTRSTDNHNQDD